MEAALRPLRYAARRGYQNLAVMKDLERSVAPGLARWAERASSEGKATAREIQALLAGIDGQTLIEQQRRIERVFELAATPVPREGPVGRPSRSPAPASFELPPPAASRAPPPLPAASNKSPPPPPAGPDNSEPTAPKELFRAAPKVSPRARGRRVQMGEAGPDRPLAEVVGVGPKTAERLAKRGIETVQDALFHLPSKYEDRSRFDTIESLTAGLKTTVQGVVAASAPRFAGRKRMWELALRDGTGTLSCRFFRFSQRDMVGRYPVGTRVRAYGTVTFFGAQKQMAHPELTVLSSEDDAPSGGLVPIYPDVDGVPARTLRKVLQALAEAAAARLFDPLPDGVRDRQQLTPLATAVKAAHRPEVSDGLVLEEIRRRLAFDELFFLQLAMQRLRSDRDDLPGVVHGFAEDWRSLFGRALPYAPTKAQARVLDEIAADLKRPRPMSRLLQGDVGSGKTAVAFISAALVKVGGRQSVLLAPTEILAEQHLRSAQESLGRIGLRLAILSGSTTSKGRAGLLRALGRGDVDLLVATHAVLESDVHFKDLGLVIIDEQHRFGVEQRARLLKKRNDVPPDLLVMTATPIPRTLTLSLYGDLRVSVLDELPPGRTPTETRVYDVARAPLAYAELRGALDAGRQAYVVFPLVEGEAEGGTRRAAAAPSAVEARPELTKRYSPHSVALIHGRMRGEEKTAVMKAFARGEIGVLVATTVVEVGVDVPNATVMMIQGAERFGLSQLHQLRGRVGRGQHQGLCLLVAGTSLTSEAAERLSVMAETNDGFVIAERDLQIRGPGELLGTRQSGLPELQVADLASDGRLLEAAREESAALLKADPGLEAPQHSALRNEMTRRFGETLTRLRAG